MMNNIADRDKKTRILLFFLILFAGYVMWASNASAQSGYFTNTTYDCIGCHSGENTSGNDYCGMCHKHGTHTSGGTMNLAGTPNKTSYAPGETVSVAISGGYRPSRARAILYDQTGAEVARSTGTGDPPVNAPLWPVTLSAPAPAAAGTYTWKIAWYGNQVDTYAKGSGWKADPNNPGHGYETVSIASFTVVAAAPTLSSIAISGPASVNESTTGTYAATATWSDGTTTAVTPTWTTTLGTISASGVLTAPSVTANQTATVGASYASGGVTRTASASVTIVNVAATLSSIAISGPASVNSGATGTFAATATWSDGTTTAVTPTWTTTLGTISASGVLTAPSVTANQTATVGASYASGGVTRTASVSVTIVYVPATLNGIAISGPTSVNSGATATYAATATWSDGTTQAVPATWSVSPTTYATINSTTGVLTAGTVTANQAVVVSASYTSGGATRTDSRSVTIAFVQALSSIAINGSSSVNENATTAYTATATWGDGTTTTVSPTWSVSPATYANVNSSGVLTTLAVTSNQSVTLTASYTFGGVTRTATMTVTIVDVPQQAGDLGVMPLDNAADVPVNTVISVTNGGASGIDTIFNRSTFTLRPQGSTVDSSIAPSEPYSGSICVKDGVVQGGYRYNRSRTKGTFIPNCPLENATMYLGTIATSAGSSLAAPFDWRFTTNAASPDSDDDGSGDSEDDHPHDARRTSLPAPTGTGKIHIDTTTSATTTIKSAMAISDGSARLNQAGIPEGYEFPDGMVSFRAYGVPSGDNSTVKITFPSDIPSGSKVYQADSDGFHEVPDAIIHGNTVTMTIPGANPSVSAVADNGVLIDPVGIASPATTGSGSVDLSSSASGGGCAVVGGNGSGNSNVDMFLILAGIGVIAWRSRMDRRRN